MENDIKGSGGRNSEHGKSYITRRRHDARDAFTVAVLIFVSACIPLLYLHHKSTEALEREVRENLLQTARTASLLVDGDVHRMFVDPAQEEGEDYIRETDKLRMFMQRNPRLAFVYTVIRTNDHVHFILDAALPGDVDGDGVDDHSYIMDVYESPSTELLIALQLGTSRVDHIPYKDKWGTFISGYAPVRDRDGNVVAILGADIRAEELDESLAAIGHSALGGTALAFLISIVVGISVYSLRRITSTSRHDALVAHKARFAAEHRYRHLFEQTPIGILNYDRDLNITDCNIEVAEIFRSERASMRGINLAGIMDTPLLPALRKAAEGQDGYYKGPCKIAGTEHKTWVEMRATPIRNSSGEITGGIATLENISSRHWMESMSEAENEMLAMIAKGNPAEDILEKLVANMEAILTDSTCSILLLDTAGRRFAHAIAPSLPKAYNDAVFTIDIGPDVGSCGAAAFTGNVVIASDIQTHPNWINHRDLAAQYNLRACWSMPIQTGSGKIAGTFAIYYRVVNEPSKEELTLLERAGHLAGIAIDRINVELELRNERTLLRTLIDHLPDIIFIKSMDLRYLAANQSAARFLGVNSESDLLGKTDADLFSPKEAELHRQTELRVLQEASVIHNETTITHPDRGIMHLSSSYLPLRDRAGNVIGLIMIARDITDLYLAQEEKLRGQKLESLGKLAGGIAHDFNNILTSILGSLSMLRQPNTETTAADLLSHAEQATLRARDLTHRLITYSKGGLPVKKPATLATVLTDAAELALKNSPSSVVWDVDPHLWRVEIDIVQIGQVMQNLLSNADESMPGGGIIHIRATNRVLDQSVAGDLAPGNYVEVSVRDSGDGIDPAIQGKIFAPFFTTKKNGNGLGLSTAHSIIAKHDGGISMKSEPGQGSVFTFLLPALRSNSEFVAPNIIDETAKPEPRRILVMDDEEGIVKITALILQRAGYQVKSAKNGQEAIRLYQEAMSTGAPFDLVILDLTIPNGMGGKDTFELLKKINPDVRALVSSGYSVDDVLSRHEMFGFKGALTKPFQREELINAINAALTST
ncbi:MAG TPA: PAS domain-containing protein [Kiritimatiellia bacterium]|nr:PAS domain-containing protein [Kiritimatiellia bacterium]